MPTIYDLFGYPLDDRSKVVENNRKVCQCPFMGTTCDGGGNRYQTEIKLTQTEPLTQYFNPDIKAVVPGICSIMAGEDIWVVCPRRLLAMRYGGEGLPPVNHQLQEYERDVLVNAGLPRGVDIGIWSEVYLKQKAADADINYHFDYIAAPLINVSLEEALWQQNLSDIQIESELKGLVEAAKKSGYYPKGQRNPAKVAILLPDITHPYILEVMTASTSGSDSEHSTDIRSAFRNAILSNDHTSPGINKRQVWGRMVTQLFAKTALAYQWGGRTVWVIQDKLLRNIELTTRLRTSTITNNPHQNIHLVVMHYEVSEDGKRKMAFKTTIAGEAGIDFEGNNTFTDILLSKAAPHKIELLKAILRRKLDAIVHL
ncbi:hypothetical protein F7734_13430 [Scytonema sp. UIC 10036]|uniref:hypothetical protein n=1 Tax=Scytonema sp. UIC 10036 TaxID=2304196 RepID=UPI0012DAEB1F|nr:hypothetical protein [Scytonema sp. UIC 10036]MUG93374.1 hypothetical protein [Scytonema sp. UIC 10036]